MVDHGSTRALKKKVADVASLLTAAYGYKEREEEDDPLDTLIGTILSQNTSDVNSHRAFESLKRRYDSWAKLLNADTEEIADVIRSGGLAEIKAERIVGVLRLLKEERGELDLRFLEEMSVEEAEHWLMSVDGVGPKTAAIVLLFSFGMPAFPVDTHVFRVGKRLGLIRIGDSREEAQKALGSIIPAREYFNTHLNMIEHGRRVCRSRNPRCGVCIVSGLCPSRRKSSKAQA